MIRVDGQSYRWIGNAASDNTRTVTSEITPSRSIFRLEAGPIQLNVTYLSPIEVRLFQRRLKPVVSSPVQPNDYVRQSMPFSYMYIDGIVASDSQPHTVQVYSDITAGRSALLRLVLLHCCKLTTAYYRMGH